MKTIGTTEASLLLEISSSRLRYLLSLDRVKGAYKKGRLWQIPLYNGMPRIKGKRTRSGPKSTWRKRPRRADRHIHVNQGVIRDNQADKTNKPPISVKCGGRNQYGHEVDILGPCRLIYRPHHPLDCGARLWIKILPGVNVVVREFMTFDRDQPLEIESA